MKVVLTYGTFDIFHIGHVNILRRLREMGDKLIVGVSTDEFNLKKGKVSLMTYSERAEVVASIRYVDEVFPENSWEQKRDDILKYNVSIFGIGDDWAGKFDDLNDICKVIYLPRTHGISSTKIKSIVSGISANRIAEMQAAVEQISQILKTFGNE